MEGAWLARARWRWRGAWLRPAFAVLSVADALIAGLLPATGESASVIGALILAVVLNLIAVIVITIPLGALVRRRRPDLPVIIARDRAGTCAVALVTIGFLALGVAHRPAIEADQSALRDAVARATAWIGDRAPRQFRANLDRLDTYTIQPGSIYRTCVPNATGTRAYCVVVKRFMPFAHSVQFAGSEPNSIFAEGAN
jgi:hypothetical protein